MLPPASFSLAECGGLLFGLAYIYFAHVKSNLSWIFGILSAICIIIVNVTKTHLYFDAVLHSFFLLMSMVGLYLWSQGAQSKKEIRISKMPMSSYLGYLLISIIISGAAGYLLDKQTDAVYPYIDCFQMMLSIFATFLIIYCVINAWSYWIVVDILSIALYVLTGAYLLALLYIGYTISNSMKWHQWRKLYATQREKRGLVT